MPFAPHRPEALTHRVFRARDAIQSGLVTRRQLKGAAWRRLLRGVYADATLEYDHRLAIDAATLVIPTSAAVTGMSAAWLWGVRMAAPADPVDVVAPRAFGPVAGLRIRCARLPDEDVDTLLGVRLTTPARTAWELALRLDTADAVAVLDALARLERIDRPRLAGFLAAHRGRPGSLAAKRAFSLVDGRAESPQESRLRVHLAVAGLPRPVPQYEVRVEGRFVARVDLAWPQPRVAVEYDGAWHAEPGQLRRDRARLNRLLAAGWLVHHVTAADMHDVPQTVTAVRRLLERRGAGGTAVSHARARASSTRRRSGA